MKVLSIIASPKGKGTGYEISTRIIRELEQLCAERGESLQSEHLILRDVELEMCRGCFLCVTKGIERCPIRDDREMIEEKIDAADGVIIVSPCYVSNVPAIMKNLMDRLCYTNHRPRFFRQKLMLVSHAGAGMEKTIEALRHALGAGPEIAGQFSLLSPPWPLAQKVREKQQRRIRKEAARLYSAVKRDEAHGGLPQRPKLGAYIRFRFFKKISVDTRQFLEADYDYYREMERYYYPARIGPIKRIAARLALTVSMRLMRDMAPA
jgi:NAD(P)H-dependent FMN reductase